MTSTRKVMTRAIQPPLYSTRKTAVNSPRGTEMRVAIPVIWRVPTMPW